MVKLFQELWSAQHMFSPIRFPDFSAYISYLDEKKNKFLIGPKGFVQFLGWEENLNKYYLIFLETEQYSY